MLPFVLPFPFSLKPLDLTCRVFCGFLAFFFFGIVFVPIAVFAICAFFALPLWALECAEVTAEYGPSPEDVEASAPGFCSWYEWWKYIVGNLVGVGGLTSVGPESGHVAAEVIDLLISVWSLTIAGLVIGIVGNMAWVGLLTEGADSKISSASERVMARMKLLAASEEGISLSASSASIDLKDAHLRAHVQHELRARFCEVCGQSYHLITRALRCLPLAPCSSTRLHLCRSIQRALYRWWNSTERRAVARALQ